MFVLDIPDDILYELLSLWLQASEVTLLDSALCNEKQRKVFLSLLSRTQIICCTNKELGKPNFYRWASYRRMILKEMAVWNYLFSYLAKRKIDTDSFSNVNKLHLLHPSKKLLLTTYLSFINTLRLNKLIIHLIPGEYEECDLLDDSNILELNRNLTSLTEFRIIIRDGSFKDTCEAIISNNPQLEAIEIAADYSYLKYICIHCPKIKSIKLISYDIQNIIKDVIHIVRNYPSIDYINLNDKLILSRQSDLTYHLEYSYNEIVIPLLEIVCVSRLCFIPDHAAYADELINILCEKSSHCLRDCRILSVEAGRLKMLLHNCQLLHKLNLNLEMYDEVYDNESFEQVKELEATCCVMSPCQILTLLTTFPCLNKFIVQEVDTGIKEILKIKDALSKSQMKLAILCAEDWVLCYLDNHFCGVHVNVCLTDDEIQINEARYNDFLKKHRSELPWCVLDNIDITKKTILN